MRDFLSDLFVAALNLLVAFVISPLLFVYYVRMIDQDWTYLLMLVFCVVNSLVSFFFLIVKLQRLKRYKITIE